MTIKSSTLFTFNKRTSEEMGLIHVNMSSGMQTEMFAPSRSIKEQKIRGNSRPYFQEIQYEPLEFTLSLAFKEPWNTEKLREVAIWLTEPKYYSPLSFVEEDGDIDRIFYCLCVDSPELIHTTLQTGYINLKFRCSDAYSYTPVFSDAIDLSFNPLEGTVYTFTNFGDVECQPLVTLYKVGAGDISILNQSNGSSPEMTLKGLMDQETVVIDCEARTITSDIALTYRYGNLVGDYLTLPIYNNYLLIKGTCKINLTYQLKRIQ
jgi:phage-related protein